MVVRPPPPPLSCRTNKATFLRLLLPGKNKNGGRFELLGRGLLQTSLDRFGIPEQEQTAHKPATLVIERGSDTDRQTEKRADKNIFLFDFQDYSACGHIFYIDAIISQKCS